MSQRKQKQTTEEVMAAREALEAKITTNEIPGCTLTADQLADNVRQFPLPDDAATAAEVEPPAPAQAECPYCGKQMILDCPGCTDLMHEAAMRCDCEEARADQQGSTIGEKVDMLFGEGSTTYGFPTVMNEDEVNLIKTFAQFVINGDIKAVTITLNNSEKAVIVTVKDAIKVRRTKATKAEAEA